MKTQDQVWDVLDKRYPKFVAGTTAQFHGREEDDRGLWCNGEDGHITAKDGMPLCDYWADDLQEKHYVFGVHKELNELLESMGWYAEWYDAGTLMIYPI